MKTAFSHWKRRIAPVFDTARQIRIIEIESGRRCGEAPQNLPDGPVFYRVLRLVELGVDSLVCGAVSRSTHELVSAYGIEVVPFVAGDLEKVIQAWLQGRLMRDAFAMPGCRGRRRRRNGEMHESYSKEDTMVKRRGGMGAGNSSRPGRGGRGPGRMGGAAAAGSSGYCVCPQCGHRRPHQRGMPCVERQCPNCGTAMTRR